MSSKRGAYSGIFVIEEPRRSAWLCDFSEARLGAYRYFLFWYLGSEAWRGLWIRGVLVRGGWRSILSYVCVPYYQWVQNSVRAKHIGIKHVSYEDA